VVIAHAGQSAEEHAFSAAGRDAQDAPAFEHATFRHVETAVAIIDAVPGSVAGAAGHDGFAAVAANAQKARRGPDFTVTVT
jgi:hypothetical protein